MPNKHWNLNTDLLPGTNNNFNLGSSSRKWLVNGYSLGDACAKGVTDNTASAAASASDQNLVTGRSLYYALDYAFAHADFSAITNAQIDALFA